MALLVCGAIDASETISYQYDALGRLTTTTRSGGAQTAYSLDASGNRTQVQTSGVVAPGTPSSLTVPSTSNGSYTVSWGTSTGTVTSYELYESTNSSFSPQSLAYSGTGASLAVSSKPDGTYYYRVRACNTSACSAYQGPASVTVTATPPSPITLTGRSVSTNLASFVSTATYQLTSAGDIMTSQATSTALIDVGDWLSPKSGMSNYQVRRASGGCNGPSGWIQLSTSPSWSITVGSPNTSASCSMTLEISAVANPSLILATATINLQALRH